MARLTEYTDEERAHGIAVAQSYGGNVKKAARHLGVARSTLRGWLGVAGQGPDSHPRQPPAQVVKDQREALIGKWETLALLSTDRAIAVVGDAKSVRDLAIVAGIATEKLELLNGRATSRNASIVIHLAGGNSLKELADRTLTGTSEPPAIGAGTEDVPSPDNEESL